jgi:hypothetical protein
MSRHSGNDATRMRVASSHGIASANSFQPSARYGRFRRIAERRMLTANRL